MRTVPPGPTLANMVFRVLLCNWLIAALAAGAFAQTKDAPVRIVVLGDSLVAGYQLKASDAFPAQLERALKAKGHAVDVINAGVSGDTTANGLERLRWAVPERTDAVILELGANDALRGLPLDMTEDNLAQMTRSAQQAGARVLLVGMQVPPNYGTAYSDRFTGLYPKIAKAQKAAVVPFLLKGVSDGVNPTRLFQADRLHPTEEAQPMILDNVWPELKKLVLAPAGVSPP